MSNNYCFPHAFDENGYPRIDREMSPEDYNKYRSMMDSLYEALHNSEEILDMFEKSKNLLHQFAFVRKDRLDLISQDSEICEDISYPISGESMDPWNCETLKTHGIFLIIAYAVLNYFGKEVSLEDLTQIAVYGGWHHKNGTWWHYLDVVFQAYGLYVVREKSWLETYNKLCVGNFLTVALLDHEMFPEITGNSLVLITSICDGEIKFFHPKKGTDCIVEGIDRFTKYTRVLWGISNMEIDSNL